MDNGPDLLDGKTPEDPARKGSHRFLERFAVPRNPKGFRLKAQGGESASIA